MPSDTEIEVTSCVVISVAMRAGERGEKRKVEVRFGCDLKSITIPTIPRFVLSFYP